MNKLLCLVFFLVLFAVTVSVKAQIYAYSNFTITVNELCYTRIYPAGTIYLGLLASRAGSSMETKTNSSTYLQMTSISPANQPRRVTAIVSSGNVPAGTRLQLTVSPCTTGSGTFGNVWPTITLDRSGQKNLITDIGSCYTGTTSTSGYNLYYSWGVDPDNYTQLRATPTVSITVTYTITTL